MAGKQSNGYGTDPDRGCPDGHTNTGVATLPSRPPSADELSFTQARFPTLEINRTFYSLVEPRTMRDWRDRAPATSDAVKGSRFITHNKLGDIEEPMARFLASGLVELEEKLGPILWAVGPEPPSGLRPAAQFMAALPRKLGNRGCVTRSSLAMRVNPDLARIAREHNVAIASRTLRVGRMPKSSQPASSISGSTAHGRSIPAPTPA